MKTSSGKGVLVLMFVFLCLHMAQHFIQLHILILFDALNGATIHSAALRTEGAAGPSGLDAFGWRCLSSYVPLSRLLIVLMMCVII